MLTATFLHIPKIGIQTERRFWEAGVRSWQDALTEPGILPVNRSKRAAVLETVAASATALEQGNFRFFAETLLPHEHWRAVPQFRQRLGFLDIETNGGMNPDDITLIGVYDGSESRFYIKGQNLEDFPQEMERCAVWLTYFGTGFDLPFLRRRFPELAFDQLHVDLCPLLRRLGYTGGLKRVEEQVGVRRTPEVEGLTGFDAVHLWRQWRRFHDEEALRRLIQYNRADIENLALLFDFAFPRLVAETGYPIIGTKHSSHKT